MHSVSPALRRSSSAIRSSIRAVQVLESRDQSRAGRRPVGGSLASSDADLLEREADPLGEDDERDPPEHRATDNGGGRSPRAPR